MVGIEQMKTVPPSEGGAYLGTAAWYEQEAQGIEFLSAELAYVRAVAYLRSGAMDEQVVFINAPDFVDDYRVNFVELYVSAFDNRGRPIDDLDLADLGLDDG